MEIQPGEAEIQPEGGRDQARGGGDPARGGRRSSPRGVEIIPGEIRPWTELNGHGGQTFPGVTEHGGRTFPGVTDAPHRPTPAPSAPPLLIIFDGLFHMFCSQGELGSSGLSLG